MSEDISSTTVMTEELPLPLVYKTQIHPPPRPRSSDAKIMEAAAREVLPEVMRWIGNSVPDDPDAKTEYEQEVLDDLIGAIEEHDGDAYKMAKHLDHEKLWSVDKDLVDILEGLSTWTHERAAVKEWVAANLVRPTMAIGDRITHKRHGAGQIVEIDEAHATYVVLFDCDKEKTARGHVGTNIAYEDVCANCDALPQ